jgi:hypothetical protein
MTEELSRKLVSNLFYKLHPLSNAHHHHHYHHLAIMDLGHLLIRSGLTHPEVSLTLYPGSFCILVCGFFIILVNLLHGILFTCCIQFLL